MTLYDIIQAFEAIALDQPTIQMVVKDDIYSLNDHPEAKYGVFGYTQGQHSVNSDMMTYALTLFYVDRLTETGDNRLFIQSVGMDTLANILAIIAEEYPVEVASSTFDSFTERFSDECAGVMASVTITTPRNIICANN